MRHSSLLITRLSPPYSVLGIWWGGPSPVGTPLTECMLTVQESKTSLSVMDIVRYDKPKGMKRSHSNFFNNQQNAYPSAAEFPGGSTMGQWFSNGRSDSSTELTATISLMDEDARSSRLDSASPYQPLPGSKQSTHLVDQTAPIDNQALARKNPVPHGMRTYIKEEQLRSQNDFSPSDQENMQPPTQPKYEDRKLSTHQRDSSRLQGSLSTSRTNPFPAQSTFDAEPWSTFKRDETSTSAQRGQSRTSHPFFGQASKDHRFNQSTYPSPAGQSAVGHHQDARPASSEDPTQARPRTYDTRPSPTSAAVEFGRIKVERNPSPKSANSQAFDRTHREGVVRGMGVERESYEIDRWRGQPNHNMQPSPQRSAYGNPGLSSRSPIASRRIAQQPAVGDRYDYTTQMQSRVRAGSQAPDLGQAYDPHDRDHHVAAEDSLWQSETQQHSSYDEQEYDEHRRPSEVGQLQAPVFSGSFSIPALSLKNRGSRNDQLSSNLPAEFGKQDNALKSNQYNNLDEQYQFQGQNQGEAVNDHQVYHDQQCMDEDDHALEAQETHQSHRIDQQHEAPTDMWQSSEPQVEYSGEQVAQEKQTEHEDNKGPGQQDTYPIDTSAASEKPEDERDNPEQLFPIPSIVKTPVTLLERIDCGAIWQEKLSMAKEHEHEPSWDRVRSLRNKQGTTVNNAHNFYETMLRSLVGLQEVKDKELKRKVHLTERYRGAISTLYGQFANAQRGGLQNSVKRRRTDIE
ncbi:hypothetical protein IAU59_003545 [Kwoniella sp. CBS 9459]